MEDDHGHASREDLERLFRSALPREESQRIIRHLLARCPRCLEVAREVAPEEGFSPAGDPLGPPALGEADRYAEEFLEALRGGGEVENRAARERLRGIGLWSALEEEPQERRLWLVRHDPAFQTSGLFDRLLEVARATALRDPAAAADVAHLALAVAEALDPAGLGAGRLADLRAGALAALGDAKRRAADFAGAAAAFAQAGEALDQGTGDPLERARLIGHEASLLVDLGRLEAAAGALERAAEIYRGASEAHLWGGTLLQQGAALGPLDPERGVELLQDALALLDPVREPRLELCARHHLAWFLNDSHRPEEALVMLELSRPLYQQWADAWTRLRLHWLEGRILRALDDLPGAERTLRRLWQGFLRRELRRDLALLSVDLAEVCAVRGKSREAAALAGEVYALLQGWGLHAEGLATWFLFKESLARETASGTVFRETAEYLRRAWFRPLEEREG